MNAQPDPPIGVHVKVGGGRVELDIVYVGIQDDDVHVWQASVPRELVANVVAGGFGIDVLPARTAVTFAISLEAGSVASPLARVESSGQKEQGARGRRHRRARRS